MKQVNPLTKMVTTKSTFFRAFGVVTYIALVSTVLLGSSMLHAEEDIDVRVQRLEQITSNRQQFDNVNQMMQLQETVEQLRGEVEVQSKTMTELSNRLQTLYQDLDQRLQALEKPGVAPAMTPSIAPPAPAPKVEQTPVSTPAPEAKTTEEPVLPNTAPGAASTIPANTTDTESSVPLTAAEAQQEQATYQQAYQYLLEKNYTQALSGLNSYLSTYPQGRYRANAYYWLGEIYLIQNQPQQAQQAFNTVLTDYPDNPKVPDAC